MRRKSKTKKKKRKQGKIDNHNGNSPIQLFKRKTRRVLLMNMIDARAQQLPRLLGVLRIDLHLVLIRLLHSHFRLFLVVGVVACRVGTHALLMSWVRSFFALMSSSGAQSQQRTASITNSSLSSSTSSSSLYPPTVTKHLANAARIRNKLRDSEATWANSRQQVSVINKS
jgi:hypothetical protein